MTRFENNPPDEKALKALWNSYEDSAQDEYTLDSAWQSLLYKIREKRNAPFKWAVAAAVLAPVVSFALAFGLLQDKGNASRDVRMVQCYVPRGQIKTLELPDGSIVGLNAGSVLIYPETFSGSTRNVYLSGEGAFKVMKDETMPFIVSSADFDVKVLGTEFTVSSYPELKTSSVVLSEGSVNVIVGGNENRLGINQKAEFSRTTNLLTFSQVNPADYSNWQKGGISLVKSGIEDIVRITENRYDVNVFCSEDPKYTDACITARFDTAVSLEDFLEVLKRLIPGMKYRQDGNSVWFH